MKIFLFLLLVALIPSERDSWHKVLQLYQNKVDGCSCTSKLTGTETDKDRGRREDEKDANSAGVKQATFERLNVNAAFQSVSVQPVKADQAGMDGK